MRGERKAILINGTHNLYALKLKKISFEFAEINVYLKRY